MVLYLEVAYIVFVVLFCGMFTASMEIVIRVSILLFTIMHTDLAQVHCGSLDDNLCPRMVIS